VADDGVVDPSTNALRALVALARTEHFGRAAADLGIPVSTLSQRISALERLLGRPLVMRTSRSVEMTALGQEVAARAAVVVDEQDRLVGWLSDTLAPSGRELRVGVMSGLDRTRVTAVLRQARASLPTWSFTVHQVGFVDAQEQLRARRIDVALTGGPVDLEAVDLRGREVWHTPRVVMVEAGHRLAGRASVGLDDLRDEVVIAAGSGRSPLARAWVVDPRPDGVEVRYGPPAHDIEEATQLVAAGMGVNLTSASVADATTHPGVAFVPLDGVGEAAAWVLSRAADRSLGVLTVEALALAQGQQEQQEQ
jgi:DNA-binding transcriptional LysR family regulator